MVIGGFGNSTQACRQSMLRKRCSGNDALKSARLKHVRCKRCAIAISQKELGQKNRPARTLSRRSLRLNGLTGSTAQPAAGSQASISRRLKPASEVLWPITTSLAGRNQNGFPILINLLTQKRFHEKNGGNTPCQSSANNGKPTCPPTIGSTTTN